MHAQHKFYTACIALDEGLSIHILSLETVVCIVVGLDVNLLDGIQQVGTLEEYGEVIPFFLD